MKLKIHFKFTYLTPFTAHCGNCHSDVGNFFTDLKIACTDRNLFIGLCMPAIYHDVIRLMRHRVRLLVLLIDKLLFIRSVIILSEWLAKRPCGGPLEMQNKGPS